MYEIFVCPLIFIPAGIYIHIKHALSMRVLRIMGPNCRRSVRGFA